MPISSYSVRRIQIMWSVSKKKCNFTIIRTHNGNKMVVREHLSIIETLMLLGRWHLNSSSPPSAAYMRQWIELALVQIMDCCLFGAKPLSKPMLCYIVNLMLRIKLEWNFNQNPKIFIHGNASENIVYEKAAILSGGWVNVETATWGPCIGAHWSLRQNGQHFAHDIFKGIFF